MANSHPYTPEGIRLYNATAPVRVEREGLRGFALPGFEDLDVLAWPWDIAAPRKALELPEPFTRAKWSRSRLVLAGDHAGERIYVKRHRPYRWKSRLSAMVRVPKLRREWEINRRFLAEGILVPQPVFFTKAPGGVWFIATRALPPEWKCVEAICEERGIEEALLLDLAAATRWLHDRGAYHDDYRADHVYVNEAGNASEPGERFAWIDLDGASIGRQASRAQRREAFFELYLSLHQFEFPRRLAVAIGRAYDFEGKFRLDHGRLWSETAHEFQDVRVRRRALKARKAAKRQGSG